MKKRFVCRCVVAVIILGGMIVPQLSFPAGQDDDRVKQVKNFVNTFNAHNIDAMFDLIDDEIQWLSIDGPKISVEVEGKTPLRKYLEGYFKSCPSCRSELVSIQSVGNRVTAIERAMWTGKQGPSSQKAMSVYEFRNNKIFRVYYFPVEHD